MPMAIGNRPLGLCVAVDPQALTTRGVAAARVLCDIATLVACPGMRGAPMKEVPAADLSPYLQREILINALYEAAELEHDLMCTYLYAAASLKNGEAEGLSATEAAAVKRWRGVLLDVAVQEMGHL